MKGDLPIIPAKYNCIKASGKCELRQFPDTHFECVYENFCPWREDEPKEGIDKKY